MEGEVKKCPRQTRNCNIETSMPYNVERIAIQYENTCTISDTMNCNTAKVGGHSRPSRAGPSTLYAWSAAQLSQLRVGMLAGQHARQSRPMRPPRCPSQLKGLQAIAIVLGVCGTHAFTFPALSDLPEQRLAHCARASTIQSRLSSRGMMRGSASPVVMAANQRLRKLFRRLRQR